MVASIPRHLTSLERYITANLSESEQALIDYLLPDDLPAYFEKLMLGNAEAETVVRGWKVVSRGATRQVFEKLLKIDLAP